MTSTVTYPSELVPGPPHVHLDVPEGWTQVWAPETLVAVREEVRVADHFLANLAVRHQQRVAPFGPEQIEAELTEQARQRRDGDIGPVRSREIEGREWIGAELTFVDPQAGKVTQAHWFAVTQGQQVVEVVQVTGSCADSRRASDGVTIDRIVESIRVKPLP